MLSLRVRKRYLVLGKERQDVAIASPAPVRRRTRRSPAKLLDLVLAAAAHEFEQHGYSGATTAAIARRADVTEAQIFRLFPSKAELFREAIFQPLNRHFSAFHADVLSDAAQAEPMRDMAQRYIDELQDFIAEHSRMLMSLIVARAYTPDGSDVPGDIDGFKSYFDRGAAMMARRMAGDGKVAPELMVRVSFAAVLGSVMFRDWLFPPGLASDAEIRAAIADFTIDGFRANEPDGLDTNLQ
jgi:AcrR family transcriptional regulator